MSISEFDLRRVVDLAHRLDIGKNPAPDAIFDPLMHGFNIWCTPQDNPGGDWRKVIAGMTAGAYTKPCDFVATVYAEWDLNGGVVKAMLLSTAAYALSDRLPDLYVNRRRDPVGRRRSIFNCEQDLAWAVKKTRWLFQQAGVPCPPIRVEEE